MPVASISPKASCLNVSSILIGGDCALCRQLFPSQWLQQCSGHVQHWVVSLIDNVKAIASLPITPQAYSIPKGTLMQGKPWSCISRGVNPEEAPFLREGSRHRWWERDGSWDRISSTSSLCVFLMSLRTLALPFTWAALVLGNRESLFCRIWLVKGAVMDIEMLYWDGRRE